MLFERDAESAEQLPLDVYLLQITALRHVANVAMSSGSALSPGAIANRGAQHGRWVGACSWMSATIRPASSARRRASVEAHATGRLRLRVWPASAPLAGSKKVRFAGK